MRDLVHDVLTPERSATIREAQISTRIVTSTIRAVDARGTNTRLSTAAGVPACTAVGRMRQIFTRSTVFAPHLSRTTLNGTTYAAHTVGSLGACRIACSAMLRIAFEFDAYLTTKYLPIVA